jgi:hypothetical protein
MTSAYHHHHRRKQKQQQQHASFSSSSFVPSSALFLRCFSLLHLCARKNTTACADLVRLKAPGILLRCLVELLKKGGRLWRREIDKVR